MDHGQKWCHGFLAYCLFLSFRRKVEFDFIDKYRICDYTYKFVAPSSFISKLDSDNRSAHGCMPCNSIDTIERMLHGQIEHNLNKLASAARINA